MRCHRCKGVKDVHPRAGFCLSCFREVMGEENWAAFVAWFEKQRSLFNFGLH